MAKGFSVFVSVGANILPSVAGAASKVEKTFAGMNRKLRIQAAETKVAYREMASAMKPLVTMAAAGGLSMGLKGIFGEGAEYQHQIAMMKLAGRTSREMASAISAANRTIGDAPTSTLNDNLRMLQETTLAFGGLGHAIENLSFNAKMGALMKGIMGDDFDQVGGFNQLVRALELRSGKMSAADYQRQAGGLFRAMSVSGGTVNPENFLGFMQQAGLATRGYNEDYLTRVVPSLIQEFGGERAGTASTALFNQMMGRVGVGGKSITAEWMRLGLVPKSGTGGNLSATGWSPGSLVGNSVAMSNPLQWVETVLFPALKAHGINTNDKNAMALQAQKMFGRETGKRLAATFFDPAQLARIHADMGLYDKAMGPDKAYGEAMRTDPKMALAATAASLKNLETNLGKAIFKPGTIAAINNVARAINWIAGAFDNHPNWARGVSGLIGLGAVTATLSFFGVKLKWLTGLFLGFGKFVVGRLPMIGNLIVGFFRTGLGRAVFTGVRFLAVGLGRALLFLIPAVLEGLGAIVAAVVGAPVWVTVAVIAAVAAAGALIWHFREKIWNGLKAAGSWFMSFNWSSIGAMIATAIANALSFGLASRIPAIAGSVGGWWSSHAPTWLGGASAPAVPPKVAGHRAFGGPVGAGSTYLVGERGPELFTAGRTGTIIPATETRKALSAGRGGTINASFTINGANDPESTRRILREELRRLAYQQSFALSD